MPLYQILKEAQKDTQPFIEWDDKSEKCIPQVKEGLRMEMLLRCKQAFPWEEEHVLDLPKPVLQEENQLCVKQLHSCEWKKH
jgi:hypothetical protein